MEVTHEELFEIAKRAERAGQIKLAMVLTTLCGAMCIDDQLTDFAAFSHAFAIKELKQIKKHEAKRN